MSTAHLDALRGALDARGWDTSEPSDDESHETSWMVVRCRDGFRQIIDFDCVDEVGWLPIREAYGCSVRGTDTSLYFYRVSSRQWGPALSRFVTEIDRASEI